MKLKEFSGLSTDTPIEVWLYQCDIAASVEGWTEEQLRDRLIFALQGKASLWLQNKGILRNPPPLRDFKAKLVEEFGHKDTPTITLRKLGNLRSHFRELKDYYDEFLRLKALLSQEELPDATARLFLLSGLTDMETYHLRANSKSSFHTLAEEIEEYIRCTTKGSGRTERSVHYRSAPLEKPTEKTEPLPAPTNNTPIRRCHTCGQGNHFAKDCPNLSRAARLVVAEPLEEWKMAQQAIEAYTAQKRARSASVNWEEEDLELGSIFPEEGGPSPSPIPIPPAPAEERKSESRSLAPTTLCSPSERLCIVELLQKAEAKISVAQLLDVSPFLRTELVKNLRPPRNQRLLLTTEVPDVVDCRLEHSSAKESSLFRIGIRVAGRDYPAIIDLGAEVTIADADLVPGISPGGPSSMTLHLADGTKMKPEGRATVKIEFKGTPLIAECDVITLKRPGYPFLLGMDVLRQIGAHIDVPARKIEARLPGRIYSLPLLDLDSIVLPQEPLVCAIREDSPQAAWPELEKLTQEFADVFAHDVTELQGTCLTEHRIRLSDPTPIAQRPYRAGPADRKFIEQVVAELSQLGFIEESSSDWSSPVVLVQKASGERRLCVDFRALNRKTIRDVFPLPRIDDSLDSFTGACYFSTLDLFSGFWQVPMHPSDVEKTTFTTHMGNFAFKVMPFGLTNAPATFQRMMNKLLVGIIGKFALVYIDDVIVYSQTEADHVQHLKEIFTRVRNVHLKFKRAKCKLGATQVTFLGHVVSARGIQPNPTQVATILQSQTPRNVTELRSFLGLANYYRRFIADFAQICVPLVLLTKKDQEWMWTEAQQRALDTLKTRVTQAPILAHPDFDKPFLLTTDASGNAVGAVLSQFDAEGLDHPIAYLSRKLNCHEVNYSVTELEMLAVVYAVSKFRQYLLSQVFTIVTDHAALLTLTQKPALTGRLARWWALLSEFTFNIKHRPGRSNSVADYLSRNTDTADYPNEEAVECFALLRGKPDTTDYWETLKRVLCNPDAANDRDERYLLRKYRTRFHVEGTNLLLRDGDRMRRVISDPTQRTHIIDSAHTLLGHAGPEPTFSHLCNTFWWPQMFQTIRERLKSCTPCQLTTNRISPEPNRLPPTKAAKFECLHLDFIGPLPVTSRENKYILLAIDERTRFPWARAVKQAEGVEVCLFLSELFGIIGIPRRILTDNGTHFKNQRVDALLASSGIRHCFTPPYHPASNGKVERCNASLLRVLTRLIVDKPVEWDVLLQRALFCLRVRKHSILRASPYELLFGQSARIGLNEEESRIVDEPDPVDLSVSPIGKAPDVGDRVLYQRPFAKAFETLFEGPFLVTDRDGKLLTLSKDDDTGEIRCRVHPDLVKLYLPREDTSVQVREDVRLTKRNTPFA